MITPEQLKERGKDTLPGHLGIVITRTAPEEMHASLAVKLHLMAPNGYLHAGTVVTFADTACGYGCIASLSAGAAGFTTIEVKKSLESDDPRPEAVASPPIHGLPTAISTALERQSQRHITTTKVVGFHGGLKANFLGTVRDGTIDCIAKATHLGRTTQLWDAVVTHRETGKAIALFRCTQPLIYLKCGV